MPMSARLLRPRSTGFHPEAQAWRNAVIANGGTVSGSTLTAVSNFCRSIDAAGIRDRFFRLSLFAGTGLSAALVPVFRGQSRTGTQFGNATDTNLNFVEGDYAETGASGGLKGNGTNKALDTTVNQDFATFTSRHHAVYENLVNTNTSVSLMGSDNLGTSPRQLSSLFSNNSGDLVYYGGDSSGSVSWTPGGTRAAGLVIGNSESLSVRRIYVQNVLRASDTTTIAPANNNFPPYAVFCDRRASATYRAFTNSRLAGYSFGLGLSSGQAAAYYTAMQAFQTALGRNV